MQYQLDANKLDSYLNKVLKNIKTLYSYTGLTKRIFDDVLYDDHYDRLKDTEYELQIPESLYNMIRKKRFTDCIGEQDLNRNGFSID